MQVDPNGLEVLTRDECLALLQTTSIVRVGVTVDALPVVLPVNFVIEDDQIFIRSAPGTKLTAALSNAVIAVEADGVDPMSHGGWSVLVQGVARVIEAPAELERARRLALRPWVNENADSFIAIDLQRISGRRLTAWQRLSPVVATTA